jgi:hypothetical protein
MNMRAVTLAFLSLTLSACGSHYVTPPAGAELTALADTNLRGYYATKPVTPFPASIAVVRLEHNQAVTTRDIEDDEDFEQITSLPLVRGVAPIGRILLPSRVASFDDLRPPAARLHADLLLVYTVDTTFTVEGKSLGPLELISLGLIPHKKAHVSATIAGVLVDVRTGYVYGTTEATAEEQQRANAWSRHDAINKSRMAAEERAFDDFVDEFGRLWKGVVDVHAATSPVAPAKPVVAILDDRDTHYRIRLR